MISEVYNNVYGFWKCYGVEGLFMLRLVLFEFDVCVYINRLRRKTYYIEWMRCMWFSPCMFFGNFESKIGWSIAVYYILSS